MPRPSTVNGLSHSPGGSAALAGATGNGRGVPLTEAVGNVPRTTGANWIPPVAGAVFGVAPVLAALDKYENYNSNRVELLRSARQDGAFAGLKPDWATETKQAKAALLDAIQAHV